MANRLPAFPRAGGNLSNFGPRGMRHEFDTLFDRLFQNWMTPFEREMGEVRVWDFDVKENDKEIVVRAELPGFEENEINVELHQDLLTVRAEKERQADGREEYQSFSRSVSLPMGVNSEKAQATYRNGVLELHLPRSEAKQGKRIAIQGSRPEAMTQSSGQAAHGVGKTAEAASKASSKNKRS